MIHADLHFGNILWYKDEIRAIDFDDCGIGSYLHDLSIPIVSMQQDNSKHHRDVLLNAYSKTHPLDQKHIDLIDDYILSRYIAMQGWLLSRSSHPKYKKYLAQGMRKTMSVLRASIN